MTDCRIFGAPHRYIQGAGAIGQLHETVRLYGQKPLIVADAVITEILGARISAGFAPQEPVFADFGGECTAGEIDRIAHLARMAGIDVVIGAGGGKAIDTAKGVRRALDLPLVIVPTIASNDSPTSRLAVLYSDEHVLTEVRLMRTNPDVVLVDSEVIVQAPPRFFIAGIGDALWTR